MSTDGFTEILNYLAAMSRDVGEFRQEFKQHRQEFLDSRQEFQQHRQEFLDSRQEFQQHRQEFLDSRQEFQQHRQEFVEFRQEFVGLRLEFVEFRKESQHESRLLRNEFGQLRLEFGQFRIETGERFTKLEREVKQTTRRLDRIESVLLVGRADIDELQERVTALEEKQA